MKPLKVYKTYQGSLDAERAREKQRRSTKQGAFESSFVSFDQTKEAFYPLGAAIRRSVFDDPEAMRKAYKKAHERVRRKAPECLEVFNLIIKNASDRQKSIEEMIQKKVEATAKAIKAMKLSTTPKKCSTTYTGKG